MFQHTKKYKIHELESVTTKEGRRYIVPTGDEYESITTVLGRDPEKKKSLAEWRKKVGNTEANRVSRVSSSRGTAMHKICENYLNNVTYYDKGVMPDALIMFNSIKSILDERIYKVHMQESALWSHAYKLAGRVDCIADMKDDNKDIKLTTIDFKTAMKPKKTEWIMDYFRQCAFYSFAFEEMYGILPEQFAIIIAVQDYGNQIFTGKPEDWRDDKFFVERFNVS
tara:strand:+ start:229 stop:903 length:675 start_codon:yes stop_codon:yes gene_type:complete